MRFKLLSVFLVISIISILLVVTIITKNDGSDTFAFETPQTNLPKGLKSRIGRGVIHDVAYLSDGKQFAVASSTGIWFYDANTYEAKALIATDKPEVKMMAFSSDGEKLATLINNKAILIWDMETLTHKTTFIKDEVPFFDFGYDVVSFISEGQTLVSTNSSQIDLWNMSTGAYQGELHAYHGYQDVAFSVDGSIMASIRADVVLVRDIQENKILQEIRTNSPYNQYIAISSDGTTLASTERDITDQDIAIELWDIETGKHKKTLSGHKKSVECIAFAPNGKTLASGIRDYSIILWDIETGKHKKTLKKHSNDVRKVVFSPDGKTLISFDRSGMLRVWEVETGKLMHSLRDHTNIATSISLSPDGLTLVSGSPNGDIHLWDVATGKHKKTFKGHKNSVTSVSYSSDGLTIASASWNNNIRLWDVTTDKLKNRMDIPLENMRNVQFCPVNQLVASTTKNSLYVWKLDTLQLKYPPIAHERSPYANVSLSFSPDGKILASIGKSQSIHMWDVETGSHMITLDLKGNSQKIKNIIFSPDRKTLASFSPFSKKIDLWHVATGVHKHTLTDVHILINDYRMLVSCAFSPDGKYLLAGRSDSTLSLWEVDTGKLVKTLKGFSHKIIDNIIFSQDGKTLVTSGDGAVLVWDFATLKNLQVPLVP